MSGLLTAEGIDNLCTDVIPYRPCLFPIPWHQRRLNASVKAELQPIRLPRRPDSPPFRPLQLPEFILNSKLVDILFYPQFSFPSSPDRHEQITFSDSPACISHYPTYDTLTSTTLPITTPYFRDDFDRSSHLAIQHDFGMEDVFIEPPPTGYELSDHETPLTHRPDPNIDQWRVGKRPGHQGSYIRYDEDEAPPRGQKRSLSQSIADSAEKVLKKPFKSPKIVLQKAKAKSPDEGQSQVGSSPSNMSKENPSKQTETKSTPESRIRTNKLAKPFQTPTRTPQTTRSSSGSMTAKTDFPQDMSSPTFFRSDAPSPSSTPTTYSHKPPRAPFPRPELVSTGHTTPTDKSRVVSLESRARQLREAISYLSRYEEDERLADLTEQWLTAGREIAERLFGLLPQPEDFQGGQEQAISLQAGGMSSTWHGSDSRGSRITAEDREILDSMDRDDEGNILDSDGNRIGGDVFDQEEMETMLQTSVDRDEGRGGECEPMPNDRAFQDDGDVTHDSERPRASRQPMEWDVGAMLLRLSVDPALLSWNSDRADWD